MRKDPQYYTNLQKALQQLRATPVFANLGDDEFRQVAELLTPRQFAKAKFVTSLAAQGELDLFVLRQGRASSRKAQGKYVDDVQNVYEPGDLMNLYAFVSGQDSNETIEALTDLDVWVIPHQAFQTLINQQTALKEKLGTLADVTPFWSNPGRYPFVPEKGEVVIVHRRKHKYVLLTKLWPVPFMVLLGVLLWRLPVFLPVTAPFATLWVVGIWLFIIVLYAAWHINDWSDDFYAVTNRRVIHREKVLFFSRRQAEAPVSQIRNIVASRTSFIANGILGLNMGDVMIETVNSYHPISFANIDKPEEISRVILKQVQQAKIVNETAQRDVIRSILRQQMNIVERPGNMPGGAKLSVVGIGTPAPSGALPPLKAPPLPYVLGNFFLPLSRVVSENGNITYRRHPVQLLQTAGLPLMSILLYFLILLVAWRVGALGRLADLFAGSWLLWGMGIVLLAAILLILVGWFVFRYEDWRNDMFVLTSDKIIDIDRTPFGWQGVKQNVSPLDKVQNVTSNQDGFIEWLFDMGDVVIETGGDKPLVFERVKDPRQIQRDVADYIARRKAAEKAADVAQRNQELAEWISIYNEMLALPYDRKTFTQKN